MMTRWYFGASFLSAPTIAIAFPFASGRFSGSMSISLAGAMENHRLYFFGKSSSTMWPESPMTVWRSPLAVHSYVAVEFTMTRLDLFAERIWAIRFAAMSFSDTISVCMSASWLRRVANRLPYLEIWNRGLTDETGRIRIQRRARMRARVRARARDD